MVIIIFARGKIVLVKYVRGEKNMTEFSECEHEGLEDFTCTKCGHTSYMIGYEKGFKAGKAERFAIIEAEARLDERQQARKDVLEEVEKVLCWHRHLIPNERDIIFGVVFKTEWESLKVKGGK
jgi:hypothetical protein